MLSSLLISSGLFLSISALPEFRCCRSHTTEVGCSLETFSACKWLDSDDAIFDTMKGTRQCVTESFFMCANSPNCDLSTNDEIEDCALEVCSSTEEQFNIQFIIDEASNKGLESYNYVLDFVKSMIEMNIAPSARISVLAFGEKNDWVYKFKQPQATRGALFASIEEERSDYQEAGNDNRCTALALDEGAADFMKTSAISTDDNNIIFLVTDSTPAAYGAGCGESQRDYDMCARKSALNEAGIKLYVIGVGYFFDPSTYQCVVDPHGDDVIFVRDFQPEPFYEANSILRETVCPKPRPAGGRGLAHLVPLFGDADGMASSDYLIVFGIVLAVVGMVLYAVRMQNSKHLANEFTPLATPAPYGAV